MNREDWSYKNIENFYERVRMVLGAVSSVTLPDEYIDFPEKAPFAEASVRLRVKNFESLSDDKFLIFESAVVYKTASLFQSLISNKSVKKKQIPTITLEYKDDIDFTINGMSISDYVDLLIDQINDDGSVGSKFIGFRVTDGGKPCCWK